MHFWIMYFLMTNLCFQDFFLNVEQKKRMKYLQLFYPSVHSSANETSELQVWEAGKAVKLEITAVAEGIIS